METDFREEKGPSPAMTQVGRGRAGAWGKGVVTPLLKTSFKEGWVHSEGEGATECGSATLGEMSPEGGEGWGQVTGTWEALKIIPEGAHGILSGGRGHWRVGGAGVG